MEKQDTTPEFDPFAEADAASSPGKTAGGGRLIASLALLVALGVAGWNGWAWWQAQHSADEALDLEQSLAELRSGQLQLQRAQEALGRRLDSVERLELAAGLTELDQAIEQARSVAGSDRARLAGIEEAVADAAERLDGVEGRLAAVVVRGESPRQALDLAEVDYLLRSANERLRLYGDVRTADQALSLADEQLAAMDDPVYLSVRQSIAGARLALDTVDVPDVIALTEGLGQLQAQIPGLPFPGEIAIVQEEGPAETVEDPGIWARFKAALGGLVSVRRRAVDESLISLEDKDYVRQGLWLQLESARLALLRSDDDAWRAALERAMATLDQYFEADAAPVRRFREGLARTAADSLAVEWPDIAEPWVRLQGIRRVDPAGATEPAAPPLAPQQTIQDAQEVTLDSPPDAMQESLEEPILEMPQELPQQATEQAPPSLPVDDADRGGEADGERDPEGDGGA